MSRPKRMDGYIRVSRVAGREGPAYISPTVQREAIKRWADYRDIEIVAWHVDEDESGGTQRLPGLREAMQRVEAGETDGIACWRLNRFARNVAEAIDDVERIQAAGGQLAFVEEDIDPVGPFGSFILTVLLAVATLERDNVKQGWETAQKRAIDRGAKVSRTPYGYRRREDSTLEPDPVESVHVCRAYELAAAQGAGVACRYLTENAPVRAWTTDTVRRMLGRRSYLGESRHGTMFNGASHEALVSRAVWEAAQLKPRGYVASGAYPLSGVAQCGTCGAPMVAGPRSSTGKRIYRCSGAQTLRKGPRCAKPAGIVAERLEDHVREELRPILSGLEVDAAEGGDEMVVAEQAVVEAEAELDAFASDLAMRRALGKGYHEKLALRVDAVEKAQSAYRSLAQDSQTRVLLTGETVLDNPAMFGTLLRGIGLSIRVRAGRGTVGDRVSLVPSDLESAAGE